MMSELKKLLIRVPDSYYDFVEGLLDEAKKSENRKRGLISFLKSNPGANTSQVLKYVVDNLGLYDEYRSAVDKDADGFSPFASNAVLPGKAEKKRFLQSAGKM